MLSMTILYGPHAHARRVIYVRVRSIQCVTVWAIGGVCLVAMPRISIALYLCISLTVYWWLIRGSSSMLVCKLPETAKSKVLVQVTEL
jgi:hypothetical protein